MALALTEMSVISFVIVIALLVIYSVLDIKDRKVRNEIVFGGLIVGSVISLFTGHFLHYPELHLTAILLVIPISYILFRLGSIGGADVKVLFTIALLSPGIEFGEWGQQMLEAIIGLGGELVIMLLGGYIYWRSKDRETTPPLIPILLIGYVFVQLFALI